MRCEAMQENAGAPAGRRPRGGRARELERHLAECAACRAEAAALEALWQRTGRAPRGVAVARACARASTRCSPSEIADGSAASSRSPFPLASGARRGARPGRWPSGRWLPLAADARSSASAWAGSSGAAATRMWWRRARCSARSASCTRWWRSRCSRRARSPSGSRASPTVASSRPAEPGVAAAPARAARLRQRLRTSTSGSRRSRRCARSPRAPNRAPSWSPPPRARLAARRAVAHRPPARSRYAPRRGTTSSSCSPTIRTRPGGARLPPRPPRKERLMRLTTLAAPARDRSRCLRLRRPPRRSPRSSTARAAPRRSGSPSPPSPASATLVVDNVIGSIDIEAGRGDAVELTAQADLRRQERRRARTRARAGGRARGQREPRPARARPGRPLALPRPQARAAATSATTTAGSDDGDCCCDHGTTATTRCASTGRSMVPKNLDLEVENVNDGAIRITGIVGQLEVGHVNDDVTLVRVAGRGRRQDRQRRAQSRLHRAAGGRLPTSAP